MLDIENTIEILIQLSEDKYNALEKIYKFTGNQTDAIISEDMDLLNELIDKKQHEIDTIKSLDMKFEELVADIKQKYNIDKLDKLNVCQDEVKRIQYIISMIMNKVKQICDIEAKNNEALVEAKNQLEDKIKNLKNGKKAVSSYGFNMQAPVYFDKNK